MPTSTPDRHHHRRRSQPVKCRPDAHAHQRREPQRRPSHRRNAANPPRAPRPARTFCSLNQSTIGTGTSSLTPSISAYIQGNVVVGPGSVLRSPAASRAVRRWSTAEEPTSPRTSDVDQWLVEPVLRYGHRTGRPHSRYRRRGLGRLRRRIHHSQQPDLQTGGLGRQRRRSTGSTSAARKRVARLSRSRRTQQHPHTAPVLTHQRHDGGLTCRCVSAHSTAAALATGLPSTSSR